MTPLEQAILETVVYFDVFDYPLTLVELYHYLWRAPLNVTITDVEQAVQHLPQLQQTQGVIVLQGREQLTQWREERYLESERKFRKRRHYLWLLSCLPGVEAIWLVNNMANHNVRRQSDIDLLIVSRPGKIWSTRFFTTAIAKILRIRPTPAHTQDTLCLSFYLTSAKLNLAMLREHHFERYGAYWLAGIMPIYDPKNILLTCWQTNTWAQQDLPYAEPLSVHYNRSITHGWMQWLGHTIGRLMLWEAFWKRIQLWLLPVALQQSSHNTVATAVVLSDDMLKFHTVDRRAALLAEFERRLLAVRRP